jgi:hypothetical protein
VERSVQTLHHILMKNTMTRRRHSTISEYQVVKAIWLFRFVKRGQLEIYIRGKTGRVKALEQILPALVREGRVREIWYRGEKVYFPIGNLRPENVSLDHELSATEILIRLWRCRMLEGEIVTESALRGFAVVGDGGIRYSDERGTMLVDENCTNKNFNHGGVVKSKLTRYRKHLPAIENRFQRRITVLFVIDDARQRVAEFVKRNRYLLDRPVISDIAGGERYPFFFTDFETFKSVPVGKALNAKIYYWVDGKEWKLADD